MEEKSMERHSGNTTAKKRSLSSLISHLIADMVPELLRKKNFIMNEVPTDLQLAANEEMVVAVLKDLLEVITTCSGGGGIRITAKRYSDVVLVQVRDENTVNSYTVADKLEASRPMAEKIGGFLGITSQRKYETVVVFSFPNLPAVA